jgi:hypothetical protein
MSITYELKRLIKNRPEYVESFTQAEMEMIYDALNELEYMNDEADDNPSSVIMGKLYNMIEGDDV